MEPVIRRGEARGPTHSGLGYLITFILGGLAVLLGQQLVSLFAGWHR